MPHQDVGRTKRDKFTATRYILSRPGEGDQVPAVLYIPKDGASRRTANLVVHPDGKAALVDFADGEPCELSLRIPSYHRRSNSLG